jgi:hypothetical protein
LNYINFVKLTSCKGFFEWTKEGRAFTGSMIYFL